MRALSGADRSRPTAACECYLRDGLEDAEAQIALLVNVLVFVVATIIVTWDVNRWISAKRNYPKMLDNWIHSWRCLQCGTTYKLLYLPTLGMRGAILFPEQPPRHAFSFSCS